MPARTLTTTRPAGRTAAHQPTRVVLYVRVSSKDQEAEGFSIPAQVRLLREYAARKGFVILQEFEDVETLGGHPKPAIYGHLKTGQRDS